MEVVRGVQLLDRDDAEVAALRAAAIDDGFSAERAQPPPERWRLKSG
jgi:hypothetical protein